MKVILRACEVPKEVGGKSIFLRMKKAGWIHPVEQQKRLTTYNGLEVQKAAIRYVNGEELPR